MQIVPTSEFSKPLSHVWQVLHCRYLILSRCSWCVLLCVRPHCRKGSFCTCLPSIRVVHVLDEHVWLEINALIGISEGNSAKGPQLHVPAQQTGSRALTIYRALCGWLWQMRILSNFERFGQQTWCLLCTSSTSILSQNITTCILLFLLLHAEWQFPDFSSLIDVVQTCCNRSHKTKTSRTTHRSRRGHLQLWGLALLGHQVFLRFLG